jgi:hypothetical protein
MVPHPTDFNLGGSTRPFGSDTQGVGWPAQPTLIPTPIVCALTAALLPLKRQFSAAFVHQQGGTRFLADALGRAAAALPPAQCSLSRLRALKLPY